MQLVDSDSSTDSDGFIQAERERREALVAEFLSRGNVLASTAYGSITLEDDGSFLWEGYDILVPDVLPATFTGSGRLEFSVFLSDEMRARYDGVFRLRLAPRGDIVFLYTMTDDGMRTSYVPAGLVTDNTVSDEPLTPIVVFFRFVRS